MKGQEIVVVQVVKSQLSLIIEEEHFSRISTHYPYRKTIRLQQSHLIVMHFRRETALMNMWIILNLSSGGHLPATCSPSAILVSFMSEICPRSFCFVSIATTLLQVTIISHLVSCRHNWYLLFHSFTLDTSPQSSQAHLLNTQIWSCHCSA